MELARESGQEEFWGCSSYACSEVYIVSECEQGYNGKARGDEQAVHGHGLPLVPGCGWMG